MIGFFTPFFQSYFHMFSLGLNDPCEFVVVVSVASNCRVLYENWMGVASTRHRAKTLDKLFSAARDGSSARVRAAVARGLTTLVENEPTALSRISGLLKGDSNLSHLINDKSPEVRAEFSKFMKIANDSTCTDSNGVVS